MEEIKVEETTGTEKVEALNLDAVDEPAGKGKKVIKWLVRGLVIVATAVTGFILGRATGHDDDNEETSETDEAA